MVGTSFNGDFGSAVAVGRTGDGAMADAVGRRALLLDGVGRTAAAAGGPTGVVAAREEEEDAPIPIAVGREGVSGVGFALGLPRRCRGGSSLGTGVLAVPRAS